MASKYPFPGLRQETQQVELRSISTVRLGHPDEIRYFRLILKTVKQTVEKLETTLSLLSIPFISR